MYDHTEIGEMRVSMCSRRQPYPPTPYKILRYPSCNQDIVAGTDCIYYPYVMDKAMYNTGTLTLKLTTAESCIYQNNRNGWVSLNKIP